LRYSELYPEVPVSSDERQRYGKLISRYYAYTFSRLRRLVERAGENALLLIISDHGFEREGEAYFNHHFAPPGVLIALGGGAEKVRARLDAGIYDVAPTILWLAGYPPARDMPGRPLVDLFPDAGRTPLAPESLPDSYGYRWTRLPVRVADDPKSEQQMLELLRTLGYIK
jgi:predicted AlkP superfamily phosphohydrolase/phosphomutase